MTHDFEARYLKDDEMKSEKKEGNREGYGNGFVALAPHEPPAGPIYGQYGQQVPYGQQTQYGQPPGLPTSSSLPPGWTQLWDQSSQRWYYTESATCRTQWDPPVYSPPPQGGFLPLGHENDRRGSFGYNPPPPGALPTTGQYGQLQSGEEKKIDKKSHGGLIAGAAGGLVVGAVGGALVGSALSDSDSDDERHRRVVGVPLHYGPEQQYYQGSARPVFRQETGLPAVLPDETASGHSVSSSDKEDVQEARVEYENASASDKEEALEEYQEKYEETYD